MLTQDRVTVGSHTLRHQYSYDRRGLLTTVGISHATSGSFSQILALDYDIAGAVTERHLGTGGGQTAVPYAYDVAGRIHEIGDVDRVINPDPFAARYSYTPSGLIETMEVRSPSTAQACDAIGFWEYACTDRWRYTFAYDGLSRITSATYAGLTGGDWTTIPFYDLDSVSYDAQGNLLSLRRWQPTAFSTEQVDNLTYTYTPRTNRLASVADAVTTDLDWDAKPSTFQYNRVGSMTLMAEALSPGIARRTDVLLYDERQLPEELQLVTFDRISLSDSLYIRYRYDVNGQRIIKRIRETATGPDVVFERYVRDGNRLVGVFGENNELKNWNIGGIAGLVGRADPATLGFTRRFYISDHLGSIRAVVNQSGTVIEGRDYYPYGLTMPGRFYVQADTTREGFTGHELDKETGLYYAGARFYGPALARWFVVDPLAEDPTQVDKSPYAYSWNNPISLNDPDGRCPFCIAGLKGFVQEYGIQVSVNLISGQRLVDALINVDVGDIAAAGLMDAATLGFGGAARGARAADRIADARRANRADNAAGATRQADDAGERTFQTYTRTHPETGQVYSGRTSGTGTPEQNIARRGQQQRHLNDEGFASPDLDRSSTNPDAIRGREQTLIEAHGGAQSQGGTSRNQINSIGDRNPNANQYRGAEQQLDID